MSEYIDRNALDVGPANPEVFVNPAYADGWNALLKIIKQAPAVDAAPVEYPVILVREGNGAYSALIPDFDCATCGESEAEARQKATECISGRMLLMRDDNETFPEPSKMTNGLLHCCCVDADANPDNAFWVLCPVKMEGKTK